MKRALIVLAVPAVALAVIIPLTSAGAQAPTGRTLTFVERDKGSTFGYVDNPPRHQGSRNNPTFSPGDYFVFGNPDLRRHEHQAPGDAARPVRGRPPRAKASKAPVTCAGVFALNDGTITLQAYSKGDAKVNNIAVTGGTGAYANARGIMVSTSTKSGVQRRPDPPAVANRGRRPRPGAAARPPRYPGGIFR